MELNNSVGDKIDQPIMDAHGLIGVYVQEHIEKLSTYCIGQLVEMTPG